jgi:tetratricopeptide (TPR) repeat protein
MHHLVSSEKFFDMLKTILTLILISFSCYTFSQEMRIKAADAYLVKNRFADALPIYKELCLKDTISVVNYSEVYKNAITAAFECHEYEITYTLYKKLEKDRRLSAEELYSFWKLLLFMGKYDEAKSYLSDSRFSQLSGKKKERIVAYQASKLPINNAKDSSQSKISALSFNSNKGDFAPVIHPDGIVFSTKRESSIRTSPLDNSHYISQMIYNESTKEIKRLKSLEQKYHDGASTYDSVRKIWYYTANLSKDKLQVVTKTGIFIYDETSKKETAFPFNSTTYFVGHPSISSDGKTMYFSSDMPGSLGGADIWKSTFENGTWSKPENLGPKINTDEDEMFPTITGEFLYFSSDGHIGYGGLDMYRISLVQKESAGIEHLSYPLNSYGDDFALAFKSPTKGYYTNNRAGSQFIDKLYAFELFQKRVFFKARISDVLADKTPLAGISVYVKDDKGVIIDSLVSSTTGEITYEMKPDLNYSFFVQHSDYEPYTEMISSRNLNNNDTVQRDIKLQPIYVNFSSQITDELNKEKLPDAKVKIRNVKTNEVIELLSDAEGVVSTKLKRGENFEMLAGKKGYVDKQIQLYNQ